MGDRSKVEGHPQHKVGISRQAWAMRNCLKPLPPQSNKQNPKEHWLKIEALFQRRIRANSW